MKPSLAKVMGDKPELDDEDAEEDVSDDEDGMTSGGQALLDAIKSGDAQAVAEAVASLVALAGGE